MKNEKQTRQEIIDNRLKEAGWNVSDPTQVVEEFNIPVSVVAEPQVLYSGRQICDYALLGKNGKPIAAIEAKKTASDAALGKEQAKQYCLNIQKVHGGELPFCFYTNGHDIYFWDIGYYPPRKIHSFPTRADLERLAYLRNAKKNLIAELINTQIAGRDYQIKAIRAVMEAMEKKRRTFLLVMATGTGKTRTCIALVDALMRAGWVQNTLFLVDRIGLQEQAIDAFKEHLPNEPYWPKQGETKIAPDRRVYVSTYPTMLNIIRSKDNPLSAHFFDLIVVDESHRSIYNTYKEILLYFNAVTLGLTATPTDVIDHNTFELFECDNGLPTFAYTYEEAVNRTPPYLCDFQVMKIKTKFQRDGINKSTIELEDQKKLIRQGKEDLLEVIDYEGTEIEKNVINSGTNALIVREFMEESIKDNNGVIPGKTIFFCISKAHARRVEDIFNTLYPEYNGELAKVLVSEDSRVNGKGGLLDQFVNNDMPRVAISVDMLDTGIDVREVVNLVFAKPVLSYTKFWQMIGRGTRLLEPNKMKPWCTEKDSFLILDCWSNFDYFKLNPKGKALKTQIPLPARLFELRLKKVEVALTQGATDIVGKESKRLQLQVNTLPQNSIIIKAAQQDLLPLKDPNYWTVLNSSKIEFLRNHIYDLMRTVSDVDYEAMRFEKDIVEFSLAHLCKEKDKADLLRDTIVEVIGQLPLSVNTVAKEQSLIVSAQQNQFWATITEDKLDELIDKLAPLMKYKEKVKSTAPVKFDFKDIIYEKSFIEFGPEHASASIAEYRALVESKINELLASSPILQKMKQGQELLPDEIAQLAEDLHNEQPYITIDLLRKVYDNRKAAFVQFIKHILNIEPLESFTVTVTKAFEVFINSHSYLSTAQLRFLELLQNVVLERDTITKRHLIESPFTMIHPEGIRGVFNTREIDEILNLTQQLLAA